MKNRKSSLDENDEGTGGRDIKLELAAKGQEKHPL